MGNEPEFEATVVSESAREWRAAAPGIEESHPPAAVGFRHVAVRYMLQQRTAGDSRLVDECHEVLKVILALGGHTGQLRAERAVVYCLGLSVITGQSGERVGVSGVDLGLRGYLDGTG